MEVAEDLDKRLISMRDERDAAVRAAEQVQEALRQIDHLLRDARSRANKNLVFKAHRVARAALTGDST